MQLFQQHSSPPKYNAQRNLCGRTHYVDDDTLRWHKSHVLSTHVIDNGLLFAITTSDALDMHNTKRGYRYVIFDVFGIVLSRPTLEQAYKRHPQALKAMWTKLNKIDAFDVTLKAADQSLRSHKDEIKRLKETVRALKQSTKK